MFVLGSKLGEGSFGRVFKLHPKTDASMCFAVKQIAISNSDDISEIENEISILKSCTSPYIVSYYGVYRTNELLWIIMDFCALGSVVDMMEKLGTALEEGAAVWVLKATLQGLDYLHKRNVIHRDVKAANILVTRDAEIKVADFGVSEKVSESVFGEIAGSPLWMAPEICQRKVYNHKADIWSLGITAIELVDGEPPYSDLSAFRVMLAISRNPPPTVEEPETVSPQFRELISYMLIKDVDARWEIPALLSLPCIRSADKRLFQGSVEELMNTKSNTKSAKRSAGQQKIPISCLQDVAVMAEKSDDTSLLRKEAEFNQNLEKSGGNAWSTTVMLDSDSDSGPSAFSTTVIAATPPVSGSFGPDSPFFHSPKPNHSTSRPSTPQAKTAAPHGRTTIAPPAIPDIAPPASAKPAPRSNVFSHEKEKLIAKPKEEDGCCCTIL
eukprot:TRINITY_DN1857_c0_g1_i2.p1 TRINITY_DN1857_c0_g1~~TRINITY_DN1857_c0_g1_i2.p1  ORF type:complete len:440 (-),score=61.05 TRINITY_DN1857_c0_g1_i2:30-1349(-)